MLGECCTQIQAEVLNNSLPKFTKHQSLHSTTFSVKIWEPCEASHAAGRLHPGLPCRRRKGHNGRTVGRSAGLSSPLPFSKQQKVFVNKNRFQEEEEEEEEIENKASLPSLRTVIHPDLPAALCPRTDPPDEPLGEHDDQRSWRFG